MESITAIDKLEEDFEKSLADQPKLKGRFFDPATITGIVTLFLGLFNACKGKTDESRAVEAFRSKSRRSRRIGQRVVLRNHFHGDRDAYRAGAGDDLVEAAMNVAANTAPEKLIEAAKEQEDDDGILESFEELAD
jgi:hypothetical protein